MWRMARDKGGHPSWRQPLSIWASTDKELGGRKNRQVGCARLQHIAEAKKPDPWTPQGGRKFLKRNLVLCLRHIGGSGQHLRPHIPSNSFSLWGLPDSHVLHHNAHMHVFQKGEMDTQRRMNST